MGWTSKIDVSYYGRQSSAPTLATYKNTTNNTQIIKSFTAYLGTGNGTYTWGDTVTGNGSPIEFYVSINGVQSSTASVTKQVGTSSGSGGYYPPTSDITNLELIEVTFDGIEVAPGASVSVMGTSITSRDIMKSHALILKKPGDDDTQYVGGEVTDASKPIYVYNAASSSWKQVKQVYVYKNGTGWKEVRDIGVRTGSNWTTL